MAKKCVPGLFCIENMTLFLIVFILILGTYVFYTLNKHRSHHEHHLHHVPHVVSQPLVGISTRQSPNVILDPYGPPLRNDGVYFPRDSADYRGSVQFVPPAATLMPPAATLMPPTIQVIGTTATVGVPINIESRGLASDYTQVGILSRKGQGDDTILPLMGRKLRTGVDKWQYYTISNTGPMPTKLPIQIKGRDCSNEYGCDCVYDGDTAVVSGYNDVFVAKVYGNSMFTYIPM